MARRRTKKQSTLEELEFDQLLCRALRHAWRDVDMLYMLWGKTRVEQWRLECERCHSIAIEYRDPVSFERLGTRQYTHAPGYSLPYRYTQAEYFAEIHTRRRSSEKAAASKTGKGTRSSKMGVVAGESRKKRSSRSAG